MGNNQQPEIEDAPPCLHPPRQPRSTAFASFEPDRSLPAAARSCGATLTTEKKNDNDALTIFGQ
jgi:hypothetical protein